MQGSTGVAIDYFLAGAGLIIKPGFRRFILIPLFINLVIFVGVTIAFFHAFDEFFAQVLEWSPSWLDWFAWILWPLLAFVF